MAAPTFVQRGLTATDAGGAWSLSFNVTGTAGRVLILQVLQDGATNGAVALTGATNIEDLAGTDNAWTSIPGGNADGSFPVGGSGEARQFLWIGRELGPTPATASGTNSTSEDLYYTMYEFDGVSTGTTLAAVIENSSAGATVNSAGTSVTVADAGVTTLGADRLALNFVAVNDDNALDAFTGQSGGTWAEAVAEYADSAGTDGAIQLQTATIASAGTIDGGTDTMAISDPWGAVGFALIPAVAAPPASLIYQPGIQVAIPRSLYVR